MAHSRHLGMQTSRLSISLPPLAETDSSDLRQEKAELRQPMTGTQTASPNPNSASLRSTLIGKSGQPWRRDIRGASSTAYECCPCQRPALSACCFRREVSEGNRPGHRYESP